MFGCFLALGSWQHIAVEAMKEENHSCHGQEAKER